MYAYSLYFWSTVVALGLMAPFAIVLASETKKAIQHLGENATPPSVPSTPHPSHPSGC